VVEYFVTALREHQELAIFLTLAVGFLVGRVRIGSFSLGTVVGTLLAGVVIGQLDINVPAIVKNVFFDLFLFVTGYKVGPQFFRGLKKDAVPQLILTVVLCTTCLVSAVVASRLLGYDVGTAAGLLAGAFTESTVIGTAGEAINALAISPEEKTRLLNNIPVAYAVTYLVGTAFIVWFLSTIGPKLMRVDLAEESRKLAAEMRGPAMADAVSAGGPWDLRAYRVTGPPVADKTVADFEASFSGRRIFIERIRRGETLMDPYPTTVILVNDVLAVAARRNVLVQNERFIGVEVADPELLDVGLVVLDAVVTNKAFAGKTLAELALTIGHGVALLKLVRAGQEMPFEPTTTINRGDLLQLTGAPRDVEPTARLLGYVERPSSATDMVFVGLGIVLGGLVGLLSITVGGLPLSLTASGGALVMGLVFGWLRSVRPIFGRIPEPALWVFDTVGLTTFMAVVGLGAGPKFISGLQESGPSLLLVGIVVAVLPHIAGILVGRYVLKMNPVIVLGACAGAGTITAALHAVQDEARSKLPALGYTVPYAIGNILLTAWGPVIVALMR
jgi:putative transport protein